MLFEVDESPREDSTLEKLSALKPVFKKNGTITAGNASPLTDGGSAVLLMSESRAKSLGYQPLAYIRSYSYAALDPGEQLLMGPVLAAPVADSNTIAGSLIRNPDGRDTNDAASDWVFTTTPTKGGRAPCTCWAWRCSWPAIWSRRAR